MARFAGSDVHTKFGIYLSLCVQKKNEKKKSRRACKRMRVIKDFGHNFLTYLTEGQTYKETILSPDTFSLKETINSEMKSIMQNNTW